MHIFRPSLLLGERRESRPGERLAILAGPALGFMFVGPFGRYRPIAARVVAAAMIRIAKDAAREVHAVRVGPDPGARCNQELTNVGF